MTEIVLVSKSYFGDLKESTLMVFGCSGLIHGFNLVLFYLHLPICTESWISKFFFVLCLRISKTSSFDVFENL